MLFRSADNWHPHISRIPGVKAFAEAFCCEVVPNAKTSSDALAQYDAMVLEKALADSNRDDPRWLSVTDIHASVRAVAAMPVAREGRALGVITLVHHTPGYFNDEHVELLSSVAAQSAVAFFPSLRPVSRA